MRRVTLMVAAMALMVGLFAAVAYAATIVGTSEADILIESNRDDTISGRANADEIVADFFTNDTDVVEGDTGNDDIFVEDGDGRDTVIGGGGANDHCFGDRGDDLDCEDEVQ